MKTKRFILLAAAVALTPLRTLPVTAAVTEAPAPSPIVGAPDPKQVLSPPARELVKMVSAGVSDDVIKAYIESAPAPFNLSADNIIYLESLGIRSEERRVGKECR